MLAQKAGVVARVARRLISRYGAAFWIAVVVVLGAVYIFRSRGEIAGMIPVLRHADPRWLVVALACQVAVETLVAQKFRILLRRLGHEVGRIRITRSHLYRHVISTFVPFGGPAAMVGFARDLGTVGVRTNDGLYATMLSSIASEIAFLLVLLPTVGWLLFQQQASIFVLAGAGVLVAMLGATIAALLMAHRPGFASSPLARWLPGRVQTSLTELREHGLRPRDLITPIALALAINFCGFALLEASLRAISQNPSLSTVVTARILAAVVMLLAPVFQGAGAVEFTAAGVLARGGVPMPAALAAMILFRLAQFWLPLMLGIMTRVRVSVRDSAALLRRIAIVGAGISVGASAKALAEFSNSHQLDRPLKIGPLETADLLGIITGIGIVAAISHARRLQPLRQQSPRTVAHVQRQIVVQRRNRR